LLFSGAAVAFVIVKREEWFGGDAPPDAAYTRVVDPPKVVDAPPPPDPAAELAQAAQELADAGKLQPAIDSLVKARQVYPDSAVLALTLGKLYMGKMWWNDGLANLRAAIKLDPTLRSDPDVIRIGLRGFLTTPGYDDRLGRFMIELGEHVRPALEETAQTHPNPSTRARAEAMLRRLR
jgi:hypothetical protein